MSAPLDSAAQGPVASCKAMLDDLGVVRVSGEDARRFLHGQFTADMMRLQPGHGRYAAWCTPKGRVLFLLQVLDLRDAFLLLLPASEVAALVKRLRMFVLRAKVLVEDLGEEWRVMGVARAAAPVMHPLATASPGTIVDIDGTHAWRAPSVPPLGYVLGPRAAVEAVRAACALDPCVDATTWETLEIEAGLPRVAGPLADRFLPQELGLESLDGLHFDKGCYPGQEVIARLKYRGQVKSGLHRGSTGDAVAPGDRLYRAEATAAVGDVLRVAGSGEASRVLAVVAFDAANAPLHLRAPDGPLLRIDA
jgi:folate-binding protein YgfZ